uniref:Uncharacterized protein n=1 Tax=Ignisphaera aggregans TaxID=334771 RepID=A0A7J2U3V5_9CREN
MVKIAEAVEIIIRGVYDQVMNCVRHDLHCLDPPCLTSGMLDLYKIHNYSTKINFWKAVEEIVRRYNNVELFKSRFGLFRLVFHHGIEEVYRVNGANIYVDVLDCDTAKCSVTPRSHVLRIYLEGVYNNRVILRMNIVTLIKIAIYENPYFRDCVENFAQNPFEQQTVFSLAQCTLAILFKHKSIFDLLFTKMPKDINEIVKRSPILKKYIGVGESRSPPHPKEQGFQL